MSWSGSGGSSQHVPVLQPQSLFEKRKSRDSSRLKAYNTILEQIYTRIVTTSKSSAQAFLLYTVPPFILGLPRLDLEDCIVYLVYQLRSQSYEVRYTYPNLLYISWEHHEKEYLQKQSPITQAMAPPPVVQTAKRDQTTRVKFQDSFTQVKPVQGILKNHSSVGGNPAPPRSTSSYKAPTSFLDAMERPIAAPPSKKDVLDDLWMF